MTRIAVASSDGKFFNQHFGHSKLFLIFELNDKGKFEFLEIRENIPSCNGGDHIVSALDATLNLIKDTDIVLVSQIGPGASEYLISNGIKPFITPSYIDEALKKLAIRIVERKENK